MDEGAATADRATLTAHLARLTAEYTAVAEAYEDLMHWPVDDDGAALDAWRRGLDRLYAEKEELAARRRATRRLLLDAGRGPRREPSDHEVRAGIGYAKRTEHAHTYAAVRVWAAGRY